MVAKITLKVCFFTLLTFQIATVTCLEDDFSFEDNSQEDILLPRNIRDVSLTTTNELTAPGKISIFSLIDSIVPKLLNTTLGKIITEAVLDTPSFVAKVNTYLGKEVLILKENSVRISFYNLLGALKQRVNDFLEKTLKLQGIFLSLAGGYTSNILNNFVYNIKPVIDQASFNIAPKPNTLQATDLSTVKDFLRKLLLDVVAILIKPVQSRVNQTLLNVTDQLLLLYKPVLPNNYFQSIVACGINQTVLKVIEIIDSIRESINQLLAPASNIKKRSLEDPAEDKKPSRSLLSLLLAPIRFLLSLVFKPLYGILRGAMNYIFVVLRPIVGKIILSPIENLVMAIINVIPH